MLEILKSLLFGIVEGITEWLPVSSTGHMILFDEFVQLNMSAAFKEMYLVVIQLGAILAVVLLFWDQIWPFQSGAKNDGSNKVLPGWKQDIRGIKKYEDLPENCRKYIEFIEEQIGFPITMVSNGPKRSDIIYRGFNN